MVNKKALIIGSGKMGCLYDKPGEVDVFSHAHALTRNGFSLDFFDLDIEKSKTAAKIWSGNCVDTVSCKPYTIVVLTTATSSHYDVLKDLRSASFETLVIEKPFCQNSKQAKEIIQSFSDKTLFVNYSRLYLKEVQELKTKILNNEYGSCTNIQGVYSRGLLNNGSHMLSLLDFLIGINEFKFTCNRKIVENKSGLINCDIYFQSTNECCGAITSIDENNYPVWEVILYFEKAVITITDFDFKIIINQPKTTYQKSTITELKINYSTALLGLYEKVIGKDKSFADLTVRNSLHVHNAIERIMGEV